MLPYAAFDRKKVLAKDAPHRVYGVLGDAFLQKRVVDSLLQWTLPPEARDFNLDTLDGEVTTGNDLAARAGNLPFLADHRVIWLTRAERLEGIGRGGDDEVAPAKKGRKPAKDDAKKSRLSPAKQLSNLIENLPATTILILSRTPETPEPGARASAARCVNAAIDKVIEAHGVIIDCTLTSKSQSVAQGILENEAAAREIPLARDAAAHLIERAGHDITLLFSELEKCALRAGVGNPVTAAIIDEMVKRTPQETIFDLTDALGERRGPRALGLLREMMQGGAPPELVLTMLVRHLRQLLQARALLDARLPLDASTLKRLPPDLAAQLPRDGRDNLASVLQAQSWRGRRLAQQARNFSTPQLQSALQAALATDLALKGIEGDGGAESKKLPNLLLELLVAQMC